MSKSKLTFNIDSHLVDDVVDISGWIPVWNDGLGSSLGIAGTRKRQIGPDFRRFKRIAESAPGVLCLFGAEFRSDPGTSKIRRNIHSRDIRFTGPGKSAQFDRSSQLERGVVVWRCENGFHIKRGVSNHVLRIDGRTGSDVVIRYSIGRLHEKTFGF